MRLLPVLDLLNGVVVHGRGGKRDEYRPLASPWSVDATAERMAAGLATAFGFTEFYVADLDAIISARPNVDLWQRLVNHGYRLLVDAGIDTPEAARRVIDTGATPIVGLESCDSPAALREIVTACGDRPLVFSLDLVDGRPKTSSTLWPLDPGEIANAAILAGVSQLIVLDLAAVGMHGGVRGLDLIAAIRARHPHVELITGGGVRGTSDLEQLESTGVAAVLVASALHNGALTPEQIRRWTTVGQAVPDTSSARLNRSDTGLL